MNLSKFEEDLLPKEKFKVCITGNRLLTENDKITIFDTISMLVTNPNIQQIYFGGAIGADTVALQSAVDIVCLNKPELIVVVPENINKQPKIAHQASRQASRIIELNNLISIQDGWRAFHIRNEYMVDNSDVTIAFWNKEPKGGTYACLSYALKCDKIVQYVTIEGADK